MMNSRIKIAMRMMPRVCWRRGAMKAILSRVQQGRTLVLVVEMFKRKGLNAEIAEHRRESRETLCGLSAPLLSLRYIFNF
jgi:hypothetical protein